VPAHTAFYWFGRNMMENTPQEKMAGRRDRHRAPAQEEHEQRCPAFPASGGNRYAEPADMLVNPA
jgi:hypothetical protein